MTVPLPDTASVIVRRNFSTFTVELSGFNDDEYKQLNRRIRKAMNESDVDRLDAWLDTVDLMTCRTCGASMVAVRYT